MTSTVHPPERGYVFRTTERPGKPDGVRWLAEAKPQFQPFDRDCGTDTLFTDYGPTEAAALAALKAYVFHGAPYVVPEL